MPRTPRYHVAIVGAGPAGLFAAWELVSKGIKKIIIIEKGKTIKKRQRNEVLFGVGGAGLYSDGKLLLSPTYGKTDITQFVSLSQGKKIIDQIETIFRKIGVKEKTYPKNQKKAEELKVKCHKVGIDILLTKQLHLGSDKLPGYITSLVKRLIQKGVKIITEKEVVGFEKNKKGLIAKVLLADGKAIKANYFLVAPGRSNNLWLTKQIKKLGLGLEYQPIEIGIRIEFPKEIIREISRIIYEPTLFFYSKSYDDQLRTFCVVPAGFCS